MSRVGFSLNAALSPLFTHRWTDLSRRTLDVPGYREGTPNLGIFPARGVGPVRIGGVLARQHDGVTCGATGVVLLNAAADPILGAWLEQGVVPQDLPPEIAALSGADLAEPDAWARLALAQDAVHHLATRRALGPLPWPKRYGTPPWGAARIARVPGVRYAHRAINDRDTKVMDAVVGMLVSATRRGIPVPIYAGGDLSRGWETAMPRHLVLALPTDEESLRIYDPGSGRIHRMHPDDLRGRTTPHPAFGNWVHLAWTLIPLVRRHQTRA